MSDVADDDSSSFRCLSDFPTGFDFTFEVVIRNDPSLPKNGSPRTCRNSSRYRHLTPDRNRRVVVRQRWLGRSPVGKHHTGSKRDVTAFASLDGVQSRRNRLGGPGLLAYGRKSSKTWLTARGRAAAAWVLRQSWTTAVRHGVARDDCGARVQSS